MGLGLTNEQRAHDIAVASLPFMKEIIENENRKSDGEKIPFDIYLEYKKIYDSVIVSINRDFN